MSDAAQASDAPAAPSAAPAVDVAAAAPAAPVAAPAAPDASAPAPAAPAAAPAPTPAPKAAPPNLLAQPEDKSATTDTEEKSGDGKDADKPQGAPEEYGDFVVAEGVNALPSETLSEFKAIAKESNLSQEAAQKFVNLAAKMQISNAEVLQSTVDTLATEWAGQAQADSEIGGAKLQENLGLARSALDSFGTPELKTFLEQSRLGNHPEFLRLLVRAGKAISQDGFIPGRQHAEPKGRAEVLYPTSAKS